MLDWLKRRYMPTPEVVVNIKNIPGMKDISEEGGGLKIGACVSLTDLRNNGTVQSKYKMLADAVRLGNMKFCSILTPVHQGHQQLVCAAQFG